MAYMKTVDGIIGIYGSEVVYTREVKWNGFGSN